MRGQGGLPPIGGGGGRSGGVLHFAQQAMPRNAAPMYSNIIKKYVNWNVCFSCGFDVKEGHTSKTCPAPWRRANHQEGFNRNNTGQHIAAGNNTCTKAMHKSQMPNMWRCGTEQEELKCLDSFVSEPTLYPIIVDDDDTTVVTENLSSKCQQICAPSVHPRKPSIPITHAVANTGATSITIMQKTPNMKNVRLATKPLTINLPDGTMVKSTHIYDLEIWELSYVLEGHIVPDLTVASLVGIRILCKMGCTVLFTDTVCYVKYQGKVILMGYKDPSTDLWVVPITPDAINQQKLRTSQGHDLVSAQSRAGRCMARTPQFPASTTPQAKIVDLAMSTRSNTC